ncbi:MAG: efflux RND transporter periplasmic adaptor subunit, partial [Wenzhouxiangellaceae bacterium]
MHLRCNWGRSGLIAISTLLLIACAEQDGDPRQTPRTVLSHTVEETVDSTRSFSGSLRAVDRTDLSFERAGSIKAVHVELGDQVAAGQLLAELDDRPFALELASRRAELRSAIATRDEARLDLERHIQLLGTGAVSQAQADRVQARADSAESQVDALQAAVERAE